MSSLKKFLFSFVYAFQGIKEALKSERNLKVHCGIMLIVILCGIYYQISIVEWLACLCCFGLVIMAELFNTALETVVNLVSPEKNELARKAKDISAGAVLIAAIFSAIIGLIIFLPKVF